MDLELFENSDWNSDQRSDWNWNSYWNSDWNSDWSINNDIFLLHNRYLLTYCYRLLRSPQKLSTFLTAAYLVKYIKYKNKIHQYFARKTLQFYKEFYK